MAKLTMEWVHYSHNWGIVSGLSLFGCTVMGRRRSGRAHALGRFSALTWRFLLDFYHIGGVVLRP